MRTKRRGRENDAKSMGNCCGNQGNRQICDVKVSGWIDLNRERRPHILHTVIYTPRTKKKKKRTKRKREAKKNRLNAIFIYLFFLFDDDYFEIVKITTNRYS